MEGLWKGRCLVIWRNKEKVGAMGLARVYPKVAINLNDVWSELDSTDLPHHQTE